MQDFEKLGVLYLGRLHDRGRDVTLDEPLLYDSKDLTTHAVCVGMTGSGKTGLCVSLLEEAALDGVPALVIDPKGDLGNLLLTFPELSAAAFRPWIDEAEATRRGLSPDAHAAEVAAAWRDGLAAWGQGPERITALRAACEMRIYTPGSHAGRPVRLLRSLSAPPAALLDDADLLREAVGTSVSGVLTLAGVDSDPVRSREHILLATIIEGAWRAGRDLDLATLIREVQSPGFDRLGVLDLESFFPARERRELSFRLNNLLAAPGFGAWLEGEPLDIDRLLRGDDGRPRLSIFSIAHLTDVERMFFVTMLLGEVVGWMRTQAGTASLRALLYMDEVFGYLPPTASPPSKTPMLTLLKQARAHGLGLVLATQNPVDLDYKALSNAGTWFVGRLQTERDRDRLLDGLESARGGARWSRGELASTLAGLDRRVFFMNNVHEDAPVLFRTRWAMSYLRGPLTRREIRRLVEQGTANAVEVPPPAAAGGRAGAGAGPEQGGGGSAGGGSAGGSTIVPATAADRPIVPPELDERFVPVAASRMPPDARLVYRPALVATARLHHVRAAFDLDVWRQTTLRLTLAGDVDDAAWEEAERLERAPGSLPSDPPARAAFADLPPAVLRASERARWRKQLIQFLYREETLAIHRCRELRAISAADESMSAFQTRVAQLAREARDLQVEKLRKRYAPRLVRLEERRRRAAARIEREQSQYDHQKLQTAISIGATILGGLFGRKVASARSIGRATTAARGMGRAAREHEDIGRAAQSLERIDAELEELEAGLAREIEALRAAHDAGPPALETIEIRPRKSDIQIDGLALVWMPWSVDADGIATPAWA